MAYRLARSAEDQIEAILLRSAQSHGFEAASRYEVLILAAMTEIGEYPDRPGSSGIPRLPGIRAYPLRLSRAMVEPAFCVRAPPHLVIYRVAAEGIVDILGFAHDRMVLSRAARRAMRAANTV